MKEIESDLKSEELLIKKAQGKGTEKEKAWEEIYRKLQPKINIFFKKRGVFEEADDLTAIVFKKAIEGLPNFRWQGKSLAAWLYTIARNTLIDHIRKSSKNKTIPLNDKHEFNSSDEKAGYVVFLGDWVWEKIKELPKRDYKIVYMKFFEGYTNKSISKIIGISESNVGTIICRSLKKIREKVS